MVSCSLIILLQIFGHGFYHNLVCKPFVLTTLSLVDLSTRLFINTHMNDRVMIAQAHMRGGFPPAPKGERYVYLVSPTGTKEVGVFGDKYWEDFHNSPASIGRLKCGHWSHGMLEPGWKIEEI